MRNKELDEAWYLRRYPDVQHSGLSAREHYETLGRAAGRFPCQPSLLDYFPTYGRRLWWLARPARRFLFKHLPFFHTKVDATWYLEKYPDVAASDLSAQQHYRLFGQYEGRLPYAPEKLSRLRTLILVLHLLAHEKGSYEAAFQDMSTYLRTKGFAAFKQWVAHIYQTQINQEGMSYNEWILRNELNNEDLNQARRELDKMAHRPMISVVMPVYNAPIEWLSQAIASVINQPYDNWELCLADDASPNGEVRDFITQCSAQDGRIKAIFRETNGHISEASNSALALASGEWIALMDQDDLLHSFAFYWVIRAINATPGAQLIYSDEDKIDGRGKRYMPYFKPDWNYDLFLSQNCFSHLGLIKTQLARQIGGFRKGYEGSQDHDLILRAIEQIDASQIVHIPKVLYHWRAHEQSTAQSGASKPYAAIAGEKSIRDHLQRQGIQASVSFADGGYQITYPLPEHPPLVSLIIPTRNGLHLIQQCIDSICQKTVYPHFEFIIVDNGSDDPAILDYFKTLQQLPNVVVLRDDRPFNYSQLNNLAARHAKGEILGLINNDIEVISPNWLSEMVSHCLRPGVGAVGAKLLYPDGRVQHGGVILGVGGVANHAHLYIDRYSPGYFARANLVQIFSAVTAACLLVKKSIYEEVGGLDEKNLAVAFNDVDFCIRVGKQGYRNIWTPHALLYHHESATRGEDIAPEKRERFVREVNYMMNTWGKEFISDPAYNPNLNLEFPNFALSTQQRLDKWDLTIPVPLHSSEPDNQ